MTRANSPIARALVLLLAFAWPFGAMLFIPYLGVTLLVLAGSIVVVLAAIDAIRSREQRPPFELLWPVVLTAVLIWFDPLLDHPFQWTLGLALFLAVMPFAHEPAFVRTCLKAMAASGALVAMLTGANFLLKLLNDSTDRFLLVVQPPGIMMSPMLTSPEAFWQGVFTVAVCALASWDSWLRRPRPRSRALPAAGITVSALTALTLLPGILHSELRMGIPETQTPGIIHGAVMLLLLWLGARVTARVSVHRSERGGATRVAPVLIAVAIIGLVLLLPYVIFPGSLIACGLLAGNAQVARDPNQRTLPAAACALPVVALLVVNLVHVYPTNHDDPRNYDAFLREDTQEGRLDRAWYRAGRIREWHYWEPRACLWSARLALAVDRPYQAAHEFANGVGRLASDKHILPLPTEPEIDDFLVRLRDHCAKSPHPEDGYAYEMSLLAAGKDSSALTLLKQKAQGRYAEQSPGNRRVLAETVAAALGCTADTIEGSALTDADMWALLGDWGATVERGALPNLESPLTAVIAFGLRSMNATISGTDSAQSDLVTYIAIFDGALEDPREALPDTRWTIETGTGERPQARLLSTKPPEDGATTFNVLDESHELVVAVSDAFVPPLPDKPAILVLLP